MVNFFQETVWLSQKAMAELFQKDVRTINEHLQSIYNEGELVPEATTRKFQIVGREGSSPADRALQPRRHHLGRLPRQKPMYMRDWIAKLDDFLRLSERDILDHAGTIAHDDALAKAEREYEKWHAQQAARPSPVEEHFDEAVKEISRRHPLSRAS